LSRYCNEFITVNISKMYELLNIYAYLFIIFSTFM
jgi:hypothetical protein